MERKYGGRLFTEGDVHRLMEHARVEGARGVGADAQCMPYSPRRSIERYVDLGGTLTFPADEPLFLLRGQDKAAIAGIVEYEDECEKHAGASMEHVSAVAAARQAMADWQADHPDRVKIPD